MTGAELARELENYEPCKCGAARDCICIEDVPTLASRSAARLRAADALATAVSAHLRNGDHTRWCAVSQTAFGHARPACTCGRDEVQAAHDAYRNTVDGAGGG